jgi:N-acyl-D-aspartate/D-glutamate deacylase
MKADLVISGGTIVDGTGRAAYEADVVIRGDRIEAIGAYDGPAVESIDARGCIVTPGFIDVHTHLDAQMFWDPLGPSSLHGVTSLIVGNCGVGFAPCQPQDRDYLMFLMEGVEDIPQAALRAGLSWEWVTFPEYLDALERRPLGVNVGAHISHAPLRVYAMGERGATDAAPSDTELAFMQQCVREAMQAGAFGFDTGRTTMHRTPAWDPVPGTFAEPRELHALADALRDSGRGVLEVIPYGGAGEDARGHERELEWLTAVGRASQRPISLSMIQNLGYPDVWRELLAGADGAQAQGARIVPQVAARSVGVLLGLGIALSPLSLYPAAGEVIDKPVDEQRRALRDTGFQARLKASVHDTNGDILGGMARIEHVFPLEDIGVLAYENFPDRSVVARARQHDQHPLEWMLDRLLANDLRTLFYVPLFNYDLDAAAAMISHPLSTIGLGDAGAHTSQTCDVAFATFALAYWVQKRRLLPLERMVQKLTSEPAQLWGIQNRGQLRAGAFADLNVIDLDRLDVHLPEVRHDLPTGAPNLHQSASGYRATIVNGRVLLRDGAHTGAYPGRLLRSCGKGG